MANEAFLVNFEGLPSGYNGTLAVLNVDAVVRHPELEVDLDSRSVDAPKDEGTIWVHIFPNGGQQHVAHFVFGVSVDGVTCDDATVLDPHGRKGIATTVYLAAQKLARRPLIPSVNQTEDGRLLWASKGALFRNEFAAIS